MSTLVCVDCGETVERASSTQKRCDLCRKARRREHDRKRQQTPEYKARRREYCQTPEYKERDRKRQQTPEHKARRREYCQTPEYKERDRKRQQTPEHKAYDRARKQTPEHKARQMAYNKTYHQTPERKARRRELMNRKDFFLAIAITGVLQQNQIMAMAHGGAGRGKAA